MKYQIDGTTFPSLTVQLNRGEAVVTEIGGMAWMRGNIEMGTGANDGVIRSILRYALGESFLLTSYRCMGDDALITFTPKFPGSIVPIDMSAGQSMICQLGSFMVGEEGVSIAAHMNKKIMAGLFGGEGFVMQKITGPGHAWIEVSGDFAQIDLPRNTHIRANPGHVVMFDPSVSFDITRVRGVRNLLFANEGVFLAKLSGPGRIWLQTTPGNFWMQMMNQPRENGN